MIPFLNPGERSAGFNASGKVHDWTIELAMLATLLKERSEVISIIFVGISPLVVLVALRWLISSHTSENSKAWKADLFVSLNLSLIRIMLGCSLYRALGVMPFRLK